MSLFNELCRSYDVPILCSLTSVCLTFSYICSLTFLYMFSDVTRSYILYGNLNVSIFSEKKKAPNYFLKCYIILSAMIDLILSDIPHQKRKDSIQPNFPISLSNTQESVQNKLISLSNFSLWMLSLVWNFHCAQRPGNLAKPQWSIAIGENRVRFSL